MAKTIEHRIEIDASPDHVWAILTDFGSYPLWNPFITSASGAAVEGARLTVRIEPPGGRAMTFKPTVTHAVPNRELRWLGRLWLPRLFDGEHAFRIEPAGPGRSVLTQSESFRGILVPLLGGMLGKTEQGFAQMDAALKARAEGAQTPAASPPAQ